MFYQVSDGKPADCHIIEARINGNTKNKQLKKLFKTTKSLAKNQIRLAFALFPTDLKHYCMGHHVKQALRESPVAGKPVVNKVHVQWSPSVKWDGDKKPLTQAGFPPFVFKKDPICGVQGGRHRGHEEG